MTTIAPHLHRQLVRTVQRIRANARADAEQLVRAAVTSTTTIISGGGGVLSELAGDVTGRADTTKVGALQAHPVSTIAPTTGQALIWDGSKWVGGAPGDSSGVILDYSTLVVPISSPQPASYLIDNSEATFWESDWGVSGGPFNGVNGEWARVDLGSAKAITYFRHGNISAHGPPTWKLQSSTDDSTWTDRYSGTGDGDSGIAAVTGGPITARYWRLLATSENSLDPSPAVSWLIRTFALYSGTPLQGATGHAIQDEGTNRTQRAILDFAGAGVTVTDDSGAGKTVVTIPAGASFDDGATPSNLAGTAATGDDVSASRRDHVHLDPVVAHAAALDPHPTYTTAAELATAVALLIAKSLIDAKGDLIVGTADDTPARLAVGADDYVLTAASGETAGVKWAAATGGTAYQPLTNGDPTTPELIFDGNGDVVMVPMS
jgi:hypothetical protein